MSGLLITTLWGPTLIKELGRYIKVEEVIGHTAAATHRFHHAVLTAHAQRRIYRLITGRLAKNNDGDNKTYFAKFLNNNLKNHFLKISIAENTSSAITHEPWLILASQRKVN